MSGGSRWTKCSESSLYEWLRKRAKANGQFFMRVENACEPGTPDVQMTNHEGTPFWIECKTASTPKRSSDALRDFEIHPDQIEWMRQYIMAVRDPEAFFLIQVGKGQKAIRALVLANDVLCRLAEKEPISLDWLESHGWMDAEPELFGPC